MEKTGEVTVDVTPCDHCSCKATHVIGKEACCGNHKPADEEKQASRDQTLKAFAEPLA